MSATAMNRRSFIRGSACFCSLCFCAGLPALADDETGSDTGEPIDPKKLEFCGYSCPEDCKFRQATLQNDDELKREAFATWKIEERFGIAYDPSTAICFGCKALDKPEGVVVSRCDVRACAREKKLDGCIECAELATCDKDLWRRFPKFRDQVIELQRRYQKQA